MRLDCWLPAVLAGLLLVGCGDSDTDFTDEMPDDLPAGQETETSGSDTDPDPTGVTTDESTTGEASSSTGEPGCQSSEECLGNDVCVATWDAQTQTHGIPECSFSCIPSLDDTQWCADASACCDPEATCTARGYCVPPQEPGGADSSSGGDEGGSTGGSTGGSEGGSTGTGGGR